MTNLSNRNTSNRNTSKTTQTNTAEWRPFKAGDIVLCPSLRLELATFILQPSEFESLLAIHARDSIFLYDKYGRFVRYSDAERGDMDSFDFETSLFHDTPANRQAIATLYQCKSDVKVIDITEPDDDEIVKVPSILLSDMSCEAYGASEVLDDLSNLLYIIINNELSERQYKSMARLAYDSTMHASQRQHDLVKTLNEPLNQSKFGGVEVSS